MMNTKLLLYYTFQIFILSLLVSCETTVEVELPKYPAQLTANSLFTSDSIWKIELTQNRSVLESAPFAPVNDADVRITGPDGVDIPLTYWKSAPGTGNSIYRAEGERPLEGTTYSLTVKHPTLGNAMASGQIRQPPTPVLNVSWDTTDVRQKTNFSSTETSYGVTITLDDPPEENYYSLSIMYRVGNIRERDINGDGKPEYFIRKSQETRVSIQSDDPVVDNPLGGGLGELYFKDVSFNGQEYALKLYMSQAFGVTNARYLDSFVPFKPLTTPYTFDVYDEEGNLIYPKGSVIYPYQLYVVLRTVTEEYYQYIYTRDLQVSVEDNPFAQPVQIYDNIDGGLGIFAGYSQTQYDFGIR